MSDRSSSRLKLLCLGTYPVESAAARYRVLQYFPHLREHGIEAEFAPFLSSEFFREFYSPGRRLHKALHLLGAAARRLAMIGAARNFDAVLVHREAMLMGPPLVERAIARLVRKPMIFDFDDAIHLPFHSPVYGRLASLAKFPQKTRQNIAMSRAVVAGNANLVSYAEQFNPNVTMIPTVVDANLLRPRVDPAPLGPMVLGWMGTHTTFPFLEALFPVLREVAAQRSIVVRIVGAGRDVSVEGIAIDNRPWTLESETNDLQSFDIGLYPIEEDQFTLGKSGFKAIQYMTVGIPAVCSPVGATCDIVHDGEQGFLPRTPVEWKERLCHLIDDAALRRKLGLAGRARVEEWYCSARQAPRLRAVIEQSIDRAVH